MKQSRGRTFGQVRLNLKKELCPHRTVSLWNFSEHLERVFLSGRAEFGSKTPYLLSAAVLFNIGRTGGIWRANYFSKVVKNHC